MILVDTSVWIDHFRTGEPYLVDLLNNEDALMHPFIIGELACGNLQNRKEILALLGNLPSVPHARNGEVLALIENCSLMGRGIGYIDVHLVGSVLLADGVKLWTRDKRLAILSNELSLLYEPP
ncbi:MAG: type II toxin-antitoxin system VapC family toxin [Thermosynechococcaceae cyanobacterium]